MSNTDSDFASLARFVDAQSVVYERVIGELRAGENRSHWMWFVFPQVAGLGFSEMAVRYAVQSREEAEAYLAHPLLGVRLLECCEALLAVESRTALQIMGEPDHWKLQSSMTLFAEVSGAGSVFEQVLWKYYEGRRDRRTREFLCLQ